MNRTRYYIRILQLVLLLGGMASEARAYTVTYHVLALPMDNTKGTKNTRPMYNGWCTEAITVIAENVYTVELPEKYQSPLAHNFKYYDASSIDTYPGGAQEIYGDNDASSNNKTKFILYQVSGSAIELEEGSSLTSDCHIYVTYEYNAANTIADLSGKTVYNLTLKDGFLAFNRGRNNRVSIIPKATPRFSDLPSEVFTKVNVSGTGVNGYWNDASANKNLRADVESQFHFLFKYEGEDPYNITIRTAYEGNKHYIERYDVTDAAFVNKYYKESSLFAQNTTNLFIASDDNRKYKTNYTVNSDLVEYDEKLGFYRNFAAPVWNSFALLNSTDADHPGYVYMVSRVTDNNGASYTPEKKNGKYQYYYLKNNGNNNINLEKMDHESASKNQFVDDQMYKIRTFKFIVTTSFGHQLTDSVRLSEYTERYDPISVEHIPASLKRKYCNYKYYKDAAHEHEITKYTELATPYTVYMGCELSSDSPFKPIKPGDSYTTATWYELTDAGSDQSSGKKLRMVKSDESDYVATGNFKNNGANSVYEKESEFAFIGDPYELKVISRKLTEDANSTNPNPEVLKYVGSSLGVSSSSVKVLYDKKDGVSYTLDEPYDAQTMTIEVIGLPYTTGNYITVIAGGTNSGQVSTSYTSITPDDLDGVTQNYGSATVTATIRSAEGNDKTFTLTIQTKTSSNEDVGEPTIITINQKADYYSWDIPDDNTAGSFLLRKFNSSEGYWNWTTATAGNALGCSPSSSTRVKVMDLPELTYYYNMVDKAGNIAAKASIQQTVFSPLSHSSIPSIIYSPFLIGETLTFYDSYTDRNGVDGRNRRDFSGQTAITQTPGTNNADIFVTYTTVLLDSKPIKLSENQQFNVKLNGQYIYYDNGSIRSNASPSNEDLSLDEYTWLLRNRDPYNMIIDNVKARTALSVSGSCNVTVYGDDGTPSEVSRINGAWVQVDGGAWGDDKSIGFTVTRADASHFIAKSSTTPGVYEVMAADGSVDASTTYYHIGRSADNTVKIYSNSSYKHGDDQLKFILEQSIVYTYHLIDKTQTDLLQIDSKSLDLVFPAEYQSPLVETYHYYGTLEDAKAGKNPISAVVRDIYVTYDVDEQFGFGTKNPYMLKFLNGKSYKLEDGNDGLIKGEKMQAMYPYCNGDGNLNIYGEKSNREQMEGGSSTRPRWVWFIESENHDPYHVKIHSRSTISFGGATNWTYLHTSAVHFKQDANQDTKHIVTGGNLQGISQVPATEYMILGQKNPGSSTKYKLLTTYPITETVVDGFADKDKRQYVTSFEQYWKTYNMLKKYVLEIDEDVNSSDPTTYVMPDSKWGELKTKLTALGVNESTDLNYIDGGVWHSYEAVANAQRWNGYNATGSKSKTVEKLEHWFQSFDMGDGTFEIESADIPAVLVLLDRHGWEIMRKPIPTGDSDSEAATKLAALKAYDSPMVKEYKFYNNATKADGCHKYVLRMQDGAERDPIKVNGKQFTSTSLATLPKLTADSYGTYSDIFVTYTVKEEYDKSYKYSFTDNGGTSYTESGTPSAFLFIQNGNYAKDDTEDSDLTDIDAVATGGDVSGYIIDNIGQLTTTGAKKGEMWYLQPNLHIDKEMGIVWATEAKRSNEPKTEYETKVAYKDKTGFDPYNLQIESVAQPGYYLTTHMKSTARSGGGMIGDYTGEGYSKNVTLAEWVNQKNVDSSVDRGSEGYDHTYIQMTNQTFMAVQDANGNMQLMPRFDHTQRINAFTTLADAVTHPTQASVNDPESGSPSMGVQTTFFVRPMLFNYIIVDNQGRESLRYQSAGEFYPFTPDHFKSPLATNYKYYKTLEDSDNDGIYELASLADEITSSFAAKDVNEPTNNIFVRYSYDVSSSDNELDKVILEGHWLTMKLNNLDVYADGTLSFDGTGVSLRNNTKPTEESDPKLSEKTEWHWKFLASPHVDASYYVAPDPYAVQIFNRDANKDYNTTAIKIGSVDRYAILSHEDGGYALAQAGRKDYNYYFLQGIGANGSPISSSISATVRKETGFTRNTNDFDEVKSQLLVTDDIRHSFVYKVITNDKKLAISGTNDGYTPNLPSEMSSPLLNASDYSYYGAATIVGDTYNWASDSRIETLYGLYDDVVYVRYKYNKETTPYGVPNKRNATGGVTVAVDPASNDAALDIEGELPYNIIWTTDNMMQSTDYSTINDGGSHTLSGDNENIWYFENDDPYALRIKHQGGMYVDGDGTMAVNASDAKTFMLLRKEGFEYGVLDETGNHGNMLSFVDDDSNPSTPCVVSLSSTPNEFIIFALSTHKLIYHLVIANTGNTVNIPYSENNSPIDPNYVGGGVLPIKGTTQRDLGSKININGVDGDKYQLGETILGQTYCVDAGQVSIGDVLEIPGVFNRPNCNYFFYIDNIQTKPETPITYQKSVTNVAAMNSDAASLSTGAYYYYNVGSGSAYYRVHKESSDAIIVACTEDDWNNAWQDDVTLNNKYKGLKVGKAEEKERLMSDAGLIESLVKVNIAYSFQTGLETNAGEGFVTSVGDNLWYTFETLDGGKPFLSHYTNAWGLQSMEGRNTRYTNDYLWTPLGDVYGFKMYNRYMLKNSGGTENVMTMPSITEGEKLLLHLPDAQYTEGNEIFELLGSNTEGYFRIHPVVNNSGTMYYVRKNSTNDNYTELSTTASVWTFGLDMTLLKPYIDRMGYVGGLTETAYTTNKTVLDKVKNGTAEYADLLEVQKIVYDDANIVKYEPGYYRLHSQPDVSGLTTVRYASGYLHAIERDLNGDNDESDAIPMHFYSRKGSANITFETLETGFTISHATRGDIPVPATEYDPSSIFYFEGAEAVAPANPTSTMETQGLYVAANPIGDTEGEENEKDGKGTNKQQRAVMSATSSNAITFTVMDIGGAVLLIHDGAAPAQRRYLNFDQSNHFQRTAEDDGDMTTQANKFTSKGTYYFKIGESTYKKLTVNTVYVAPSTNATYSETTATKDEWDAAADIYDLKYYHESPTDDAKWCMEPANNQGLLVETHNGGDDYYYTTFCAPYDVLLPDDDGTKIYGAYVYNFKEGENWPTSETIIHPVRVPAKGNYTIGKFVPAATPVIIRTTDNSGKVKLSLPSSAPTTPKEDCIFTGKYLEQLLPTAITADDKVYAFGLPITGYTLYTDATTSTKTNGEIENYVNRDQATKGVGFYINATHNKELNINDELWYPNNRYVIHNKIYYRPGDTPGASAPKRNIQQPEFIPVVFDDDDADEDIKDDMTSTQRIHDNRVYDLLGRCVATEQEVKDGTWKLRLPAGVYILNGKKVMNSKR